MIGSELVRGAGETLGPADVGRIHSVFSTVFRKRIRHQVIATSFVVDSRVDRTKGLEFIEAEQIGSGACGEVRTNGSSGRDDVLRQREERRDADSPAYQGNVPSVESFEDGPPKWSGDVRRSAATGSGHSLCSGSLDLVEDLHAPGGDVVGERRHGPGQERLGFPATHHCELPRPGCARDLRCFDEHTPDVDPYDLILADEAVFYPPRRVYLHALFPEDSVWVIDQARLALDSELPTVVARCSRTATGAITIGVTDSTEHAPRSTALALKF